MFTTLPIEMQCSSPRVQTCTLAKLNCYFTPPSHVGLFVCQRLPKLWWRCVCEVCFIIGQCVQLKAVSYDCQINVHFTVFNQLRWPMALAHNNAASTQQPKLSSARKESMFSATRFCCITFCAKSLKGPSSRIAEDLKILL